ncbi:alpha/beta hydrolase [Streptococcus cuniculi]|uniref:Alpha/beta hydrolase n=1 Tax=Streptococcus cuniculi TaxID=1432788 RepID=A0A4Y9JCK8_9STRE|nr:alpha/beta hydrolase [Streptococcus cuniculi]MBF0778614.1 alpha/beta hydrolase [Streptococcus cuniculi]TFU97545.1 alpha/beta hydrolase [Streptococcus cuniculi]
MKLQSFPGYEHHLLSYIADGSEETLRHKQLQGEAMMRYELPDGMTMEDRLIPGPEEGQELKIRVFTPAGLVEKAPMILDIHGGAFVAGSVDLDNARCIAVAERVPAIVVSVEYRLCGATGYTFPVPLEDCHAAYMYLYHHADEFGGDCKKLGLHGSSAGGTIAEGLALYLRDRNEPTPALTVLNCATFDTAIEATHSFQQLSQLRMGSDKKVMGAEAAYLGGYNGQQPSYYAFPSFCHDVGGLGPTLIIAGEYDTLRDTAIDYSQRLLRAGVPCELFVAPRLGHCFTAAPHPYTDLVHDLMAWSFKREFGLLEELRKC